MGPAKPAPDTASVATLMLAVPELERTKVSICFDPTSTDPKLTVAPLLSGVVLLPTVTMADGAAMPSRIMLVVLTSSVALYEATMVGLKSMSISASDAGPTYGERV